MADSCDDASLESNVVLLRKASGIQANVDDIQRATAKLLSPESVSNANSFFKGHALVHATQLYRAMIVTGVNAIEGS